ncbi:MAG TPA: zinc-ribbon domain-containing protein, partial [Geobacterales bacterium]|nr:zinc-ribbon domain-containing protein [Geobacterales bacterium]
MKIECPSCHLIGQISDASVPSEGLPLDCPRCKNRFVVKQELPADLQPGDAVNSCPACQYSTFSEETFVKCPRCGVIPRDYRAGAGERQARERQKEEEIRRQYANDVTQPEEPDNSGMAMTAEAPVPVMIIGWLAIIAAVLLLIFGFKGLINYSSIPQPVPDPYATELPPS